MFEVGRIVATPGAVELIERVRDSNFLFLSLLLRHRKLEQGLLCDEDHKANKEAVKEGERILSAFPVQDSKVWIITEADRSVTTFLLPEEY